MHISAMYMYVVQCSVWVNDRIEGNKKIGGEK